MLDLSENNGYVIKARHIYSDLMDFYKISVVTKALGSFFWTLKKIYFVEIQVTLTNI